jgi:hypothetical protein
MEFQISAGQDRLLGAAQLPGDELYPGVGFSRPALATSFSWW